ncbi:MAG: lamin tail domain-containing protein [Candidatus Kerfeldbacteria bacterium]
MHRASIVLTALIITACLAAAALPARAASCTCPETPDPEIPSGPFSTALQLSEIYPAPASGEEEFIELYNAGTSAVDLAGWMLSDASGKMHTISGDDYATTSVRAHGYFIVPYSNSKLYLNNGGDSVGLYQPDETLLDSVSYENAKSGMSWSRFGSEWSWTDEASEGMSNIEPVIAEEDEPEDGEGQTDEKKQKEEDETEDLLAIEAFRELNNDDEAIIEGVVTVLPDTFGSQYFYIQDETAGIQVYSYYKYFPDMEIGDRVRVRGVRAETRNESRIKISAEEDIVVLGNDDVPEATFINEIEEKHEGMLVQVAGTVTEKSGSSVFLDDEVKIVLKAGASIDKSLFEVETGIAVVGIVGQYDEEYRLMPRSDDDVLGDDPENFELIPAATASGFDTSTISSDQGEKQQYALYIILAAAAATIITGSSIVKHREKLFTAIRRQPNQTKNAPKQERVSTIFDAAQKKEGARGEVASKGRRR